jgi:hypothetical protein
MKRITITFFVFIFFLGSFSLSQSVELESNTRLLDAILRLEKIRDKSVEDIQKYEGEIQKCDSTILKSDNILRLARQKGNMKAEEIAREASIKAQEAKIKNSELKKTAELIKKRTENAIALVKTGNKDLESILEQVEFDNMNTAWMENQKQLIEKRLRDPNQYASAIYKSLKTKTPPALPPRKYDELQPGDVLLISPENKSFWDSIRDESIWIAAGDSVSSGVLSPASHTVLYLKEVNGKKLFLDHTSERGSHVISEADFLKTYGQRDAMVASPKIVVAQPVKESETAEIWNHTKELIKKEQETQYNTSKNRTDIFRDSFRDLSNYGLYGDENMVCSEADRWVLVNSGRNIPETASPLKRFLGIHYGPANFISDNENFIITPLWESEKNELNSKK